MPPERHNDDDNEDEGIKLIPFKKFILDTLIFSLVTPHPPHKTKDYISGYADFSLNSQSVSFLQAYLLLELISSALLAESMASVLWYSVSTV